MVSEGTPTKRSLVALALLALLFSGTVQALISPPLNLWPLHPVSWVPALLVLERLRGGRALLAGWLVGASAQAAIFYWVVHTVQTFSNLPTWAAILVLIGFAGVWGFYAAVFAWGYGFIRRAAGWLWPVAIPAWFVACEYLNPQLFPYFQGVAWYQQPWMFLVTGLTGVPGVTFFVLVCNCLVLAAIHQRRSPSADNRRAVIAGAVALASFAVVALGYSQIRLHKIERAEATADTTRFALLQTNLTVPKSRALSRRGPFAHANLYVDAAKAAIDADPDIDVFVWPEGGMRGSASSRRNERVLAFADEYDVEIWTGGGGTSVTEDGRRAHHNAAFRIDADGVIGPRYDKNILLPFGEFMPLAGVFPVLRKIKGVGNFDPGRGLVVHETPHGSFVFLICYEAIRHRFVRGGFAAGADILVNITNDAWFGDTSNPSQHLMLSAIQSAEYGVPLVRTATTGISAFVDARGVIVDQSEVFTEALLVRDVKRVRLPTIYAALGDWFAWLCILASAIGLVRGAGLAAPTGRRRWIAWTAVGVATLTVPLAWLPNPYLPTADWVMWGVALASISAVGWRWRNP